MRHRVLLLCAPGFSASCWRLILPELLRADCLCLICEMPGFGHGSLPDDVPVDPDLRAKYVWGVLDEVDLNERADWLNGWHLMAHGSAAATVIRMAIQQPTYAASLFLLSPMFDMPAKLLPRSLLRSAVGRTLLRRWIEGNVLNDRGFDRLARRIYGCAPLKTQRDRLQRQYGLLLGHEETARQLLLESCRADTSRLHELFIPGMVILGGRDTLTDDIPRGFRERDFPAAEYHILSNAGHCAMETHPEPIKDFLRGWIREMW